MSSASLTEAVVLDACCLINLAAADALSSWLGDLGIAWMLPDAALREALFLRLGGVAAADPGETGHTHPAREPILLDPHIESGLLTLVRPETDAELAAYVELARDLDDGEAMALAVALALAKTRAWQIATDDRKAIRFADVAGLSVMTTPAVIRLWVDRCGPTPADISAALRGVRDRARFLPSGRDPLYEWWIERLRG